MFNDSEIFFPVFRIEGKQNPVPKFSTSFLGSSRNFFRQNVLFQIPKILLRKVFLFDTQITLISLK